MASSQALRVPTSVTPHKRLVRLFFGTSDIFINDLVARGIPPLVPITPIYEMAVAQARESRRLYGGIAVVLEFDVEPGCLEPDMGEIERWARQYQSGYGPGQRNPRDVWVERAHREGSVRASLDLVSSVMSSCYIPYRMVVAGPWAAE